jgi:hypothetical protein
VLHASLESRSENHDQILAHIDVVRAVAPRLTLDQVSLAFERILRTSRPDMLPGHSEAIVAALYALLDAVKERAIKAPLEEFKTVLDRLLDSLGDFDRERSRTNAEQTKLVVGAWARLVDAAGVFASGAEAKHMHVSFGVLLRILRSGGNNANSPKFIQSLERFVPLLADEHARSLSVISRARLALATGPNEGVAWARLINVELSRLSERDHLQEVINILKYPGAVGEPTTVLLDGVRRRFKLPLQGEPNLRELMSLIESRFPDLRRELRSVPVNPNARAALARSGH